MISLNGKAIASFIQTSDRSIYIEFDDGTEILIDGFSEKSRLEIKEI